MSAPFSPTSTLSPSPQTQESGMHWKPLFGCIVLTLGLSSLAPLQTSGQSAPQKIDIVAKRFEFTPGEISVKKGQVVTISLTSKDVDHGFKFKELDVALSAKKGES